MTTPTVWLTAEQQNARARGRKLSLLARVLAEVHRCKALAGGAQARRVQQNAAREARRDVPQPRHDGGEIVATPTQQSGAQSTSERAPKLSRLPVCQRLSALGTSRRTWSSGGSGGSKPIGSVCAADAHIPVVRSAIAGLVIVSWEALQCQVAAAFAKKELGSRRRASGRDAHHTAHIGGGLRGHLLPQLGILQLHSCIWCTTRL